MLSFLLLSTQTIRRAWSGSKLFDTLMVFLKDFFEKVDSRWQKACKTTQHTKRVSVNVTSMWNIFACGALAASICVGIVIPSTWFVYLYKQTVSTTVVVMGTKQLNDKITHWQQVKTGFVQKWENRSPGLFQDYSRTFSFFKDSISSQICITQRFKVYFFQSEAAKRIAALNFFDSDTSDKKRDYRTYWIE